MVQLAQYVYFIKTGNLGGAERDAIFWITAQELPFSSSWSVVSEAFRVALPEGSHRFQQLELGKGHGVGVGWGRWDISQGHTRGNNTELSKFCTKSLSSGIWALIGLGSGAYKLETIPPSSTKSWFLLVLTMGGVEKSITTGPLMIYTPRI